MDANGLKSHSGIFICPVSGQQLEYVDEHELLKWNDLIVRKEVSDLHGETIQTPLTEAFITEDENLLYPIREGIIYLSPMSAYVLGCNAKKQQFFNARHEQSRKQPICQQDDEFQSKEIIDNRTVSAEYRHYRYERVKRVFPKRGNYLLDMTCSWNDSDAFNDCAQNFSVQICANQSIASLKEAQNTTNTNTHTHTIFVYCDFAKLPFKTNTLDGCLCMHGLSLVDKSEQLRAIAQLHRVLKPSGKAIIVYAWGKHSMMMSILIAPFTLLIALANLLKSKKISRHGQDNGFDYVWYKKVLKKRFSVDIYSWQSINKVFMKTYIHPWCGGKFILKFLAALEEKYPRLMGRMGAYPFFVITKSSIAYKAPHSV